MFKSLRIENFQSHKDTFLKFDKGVNIIFGLSQAGKTAIARSLRLLIYNRPLGGKFFSDFAGDKGETKITIGLDSGENISVTKSIKINKEGEKQVLKTSYKIGETEFSSPKDQVPDQVVAALNISELNIQRQFDPPFLVSSSGGEIAKTINRITRLEEVDDWISELTSEINAGNRSIISMESDAKEIIQEIEVYKDLGETEKAINELQKVSGEIVALSSQRDSLDKLLVQLENAIRGLEKLESFMYAEEFIDEADQIQKEIDDLITLVSNINLMHHYNSQIEKFTEMLQAERYINKAEKIGLEIEEYNNFSDLISDFELASSVVEDKESKLQILKIKYMKLLEKSKKCPTCFADMGSKHLKEIERSL